MTVLWWFVGTVLIVLSFVLWVAGLAGREGILRIGKVTAAETGVKMRTKGGIVDLPRFERDELARFLNKDTESV